MKFADPKVALVFTPEDQSERPDGDRIRYHFRTPSIADEARYERAVAEAGGREWRPMQIIAATADGVRAILPEPDSAERMRTLAELDSLRDRILETAQALKDARADWLRETPEDPAAATRLQEATSAFLEALAAPRLRELIDTVSLHYPRLRGMEAENQVYPQVRGSIAAQLFLTGWDNLPEQPKRGLSGLSEESLRQIPAAHRIEIGRFIDAALAPSDTDAKNSASPSGGPSNPTASPAATSTISETP